MPGIPTEHIVDDLKDVRESHRQLAAKVHELRGELAEFRTEVTGEFGKLRPEIAEESGKLRAEMVGEFGRLRTEMTEKLGAIDGTLGRLAERIDHSISLAKWTVGIRAPIVLSLIGGAFWLTWHAAKLDSRVERLEYPARIERAQANR